MTATLRQDQLAQALKRGILGCRLLIIDEIGVSADGFRIPPLREVVGDRTSAPWSGGEVR